MWKQYIGEYIELEILGNFENQWDKIKLILKIDLMTIVQTTFVTEIMAELHFNITTDHRSCESIS